MYARLYSYALIASKSALHDGCQCCLDSDITQNLLRIWKCLRAICAKFFMAHAI